MNKKSTVVFILVVVLMLSTVSIALAVTYGVPDENGHPYVGLVFFYDDNDEYLWRCSGTLIAPKVFVTAGHCTFDTAKAVVLFDPDLEDIVYVEEGDRGYIFGEYGKHKHYVGDTYAHPEVWMDFPNTYDVGVVVLQKPANLKSYGSLPELGALDEAAEMYHKKDILIRTVGYGVQSVKPYDQSEKIRYTSTSNLVNLKSANNDGYNVQTSNNPSVVHGKGGACFGDSGGPLFYPEDSNEMVAIVSFGMNWNCKGEDWSYRADISTTQNFIYPFLEK
jgi:secreted trypsin-like serine protease